MVLKNHIAYRFLTDYSLWFEMLESQHPEIYTSESVSDSAADLYYCINNIGNKPYIVSNSVVEHLDMLKINKKGEHFDWSVFNHLKNQKTTFIFQDNSFLRMIVSEDTIWFCHTKFTFDKGNDNEGNMHWIMFFFNRDNNELCEHFNHNDVKQIEEFVYKFLCFFYLTDNNEEIINAGRVYGTRKTGKISNDFNFPVTLVTSKWNTTTIRTESFGVRGHFRLQPFGEERSNYKLIFIEPFVKNGYKRTAGKLLTNN